MKQIFPILLGVILLATFGCSIQTKINKIGADKLISDTEDFEQQVRNIEYQYNSIARNYWPDSFTALKPIQVRRYQRGTILIIHQSDRRESGIYIVTENPDIEPDGGSGEGYSKIDDRIYWADIKIRGPMKLRKPEVKNK